MKLEIDGDNYELREDGPIAFTVYVDGEKLPDMFTWHFDPEAKSGARSGGPPTPPEKQRYLQSVAANRKLIKETLE